MHYNSIFQQLFNFIPRHRFEKSVKILSGDRYCKHFTTWKQFLTLLYAQITGKDSLREIEEGLLANHKRLYHLGMEVVPKSTLSEAMNRRSPEMFQQLFEELLDRTMKYAPHHKFKFNNPLYAIDSTTIELCLAKYDWAYYRKNKGAIRLHTELDWSGNLPCFVLMSDGKMADIRAARENVVIVPDSIYTFDKGYYDLNWFKHIADMGASFVTRIKTNAQIEVLGVRHGMITPENLQPMPKNPIIAAFFREIGLADKLGSGVRNLFKFTKIYSGQEPVFLEEDIFRITVPLDDEYAPAEAAAEKTDRKNVSTVRDKFGISSG